MKLKLPPYLFVLIGLVCGVSAQEQGEFGLTVGGRDENSEFLLSSDGSIFTGANGAYAIYVSTNSLTILQAEKILANSLQKIFEAQGQITLQQNRTNVWIGEEIEYNYSTGALRTGAFRTGQSPIYAGGESLLTVEQEDRIVYQARDAFVTGDDLAEPGYRVRASTVTIVPGKYVEARNARLYLGNIPVFYFPYYRRKLGERVNHFSFTPGYESDYGAYLLSRYNWFWGDSLDGDLKLDWRSERGFGYGAEANYDAGPFGTGSIGGYYTHDADPGTNDITGAPIPPDRYLAEFSHRVSITDSLTGRALYSQQSDAEFTKDFFEGKYRDDPQPRSYAELSQIWPNYSLNLLVHPQVNTFFETVERLPDLKLTALRQQIGNTPLYYEGESSAGYFQRRFTDGTEDYSATRADTFHQILYPNTFFGWLNVTPHAGGRFTYYGETDSDGATLDETGRGVLSTGVEVSFKASQLWRYVKSDFWDFDGLRHIIRPTLNYLYIPEPTERPPDLPQFDYQTQTLRLPPIHFPDFNSIDSIDSENVLRLGMWNTLQTKRDDQLENILLWGVFTDWRINRQRDQSTFSDIYSDLEWKPSRWLAINSEVRYDVDEGELRIADHRATITPNNRWSLALGHRIVREDPDNPFFDGLADDIYSGDVYYRLNENWGARVGVHYEAEEGLFQEQYYTLYRDLRSWTAALTFRVREDEDEPTEYAVAFTFSLKSFPSFKVGDDQHRPELLLGY